MTLTKQNKIDLTVAGILPLYAVAFLFYRHDHISDIFFGFFFLPTPWLIAAVYIQNHPQQKGVNIFVLLLQPIIILIYYTSFFYYKNYIFIDYFLLFLLPIQLGLTILTLRQVIKSNTKKVTISIIISIFLIAVLYVITNELLLIFIYLILFLFITNIYFSVILKISDENNQIEKIKGFYKNNASFYLHKIKNMSLSFQFIIENSEIEEESRKDIEDYLKQIQETISEFSRIDELYEKKSFILHEFKHSFELFHKSILKRNKIKFSISYTMSFR